MTYQPAYNNFRGSRPRGNDIRAGDRVLFSGPGNSGQYGEVKETRMTPNGFGGRELWARVVWDNKLREPGWMKVNRSLEVVPPKMSSARY